MLFCLSYMCTVVIKQQRTLIEKTRVPLSWAIHDRVGFEIKKGNNAVKVRLFSNVKGIPSSFLKLVWGTRYSDCPFLIFIPYLKNHNMRFRIEKFLYKTGTENESLSPLNYSGIHVKLGCWNFYSLLRTIACCQYTIFRNKICMFNWVIIFYSISILSVWFYRHTCIIQMTIFKEPSIDWSEMRIMYVSRDTKRQTA